jgi:hypothetical protein
MLATALACGGVSAQQATRPPADWSKPERGYFIDQAFITRPMTFTQKQIAATFESGDSARGHLMMEANWKAQQPIEVRFGSGTLRINPTNYYDQFYLPECGR